VTQRKRKVTAETPRRSVPGPGKPNAPFQPSGEQRQLVTLMAATGATQEQMRSQIINPNTGKPISDKALREHFREELDNATARLNALVAGNLFSIATSKTHKQAATAAIFWLKTRAGWREPESWHIEQRRMQVQAEMTKGEETMVFTLRFDEEEQRRLERDNGDGSGG
jgi:hypothetical protein